MRLMCMSTAGNTNDILRLMTENHPGKIEKVLHFGKKQADYDVRGLTRMKNAPGKRGNILDEIRYTGAARALIDDGKIEGDYEELVDHLQRRSAYHRLRSHPMRLMQDYFDYYHVLADSIARIMQEDRITHVLFFNVPHLTYDTIAYQIAKAMGIKTIVLLQSLFPNRFFSMEDVPSLGYFAPLATEAPAFPIDREKQLEWFYMKGIQQERGQTGHLTWSGFAHFMLYALRHRPLQALNPFFTVPWLYKMHKVNQALPKWRDPFSTYFHLDNFNYYENLLRYEENPIDLETPFVYFPLQFQPEMTTATLGGRFRDQALALERLADLLPDNVRILVKENPKQGGYMRGTLFYHRLARIPNLTILPSYANTHSLMQKSQFVATITGTVGWEAIRIGKPALVFGAAWYRQLPGAVNYRGDLTYEDIMATSIDHAELEKQTGQLLARTHEGLVAQSYQKMRGEEETPHDRMAETLIGLLDGTVETTFRTPPPAHA